MCAAEMLHTLCTVAFPAMNTQSVPTMLHLTISSVSSSDFVWAAANENCNFGVDGNYLMIVRVKV